MTFFFGLNVFRQRLETPINVNDLLSLKISQLPPGIARYILRTPFVDDLVICFRGRSLDTIERLLQQAVNAIQWSFFDGKSAKAVHELSSQNTCLHWKSGTSRPARTDPYHVLLVSRVEASVASAEITADLFCPLRQSTTHWEPINATWQTQPQWGSRKMYDFQPRSPT